MKKILIFCTSLFIAISLMGCASPSMKVTDSNIVSNPTGERLYPYKVTTDSGKTFKYGYINNKGKIIIKPEYDDADIYVNGYYRIKHNNKWGLLDAKGNQIIKPVYQFIGSPSGGLIAAEQNNKYGYIDIKCNTIIPFQFDYALDFSEGKANVIYKGNNQFIDEKGKLLNSNSKYGYLGDFNDGCAIISSKSGFGYIDENFKIIIPPKYKIAENFIKGIALVGYSPDNCFLINKKGETLVKFPAGYNLDVAHTPQDGKGFIPVTKNGKWGYVDMKGNIAVDCAYDGTCRFINGYAIVIKDGNVSIMDDDGKVKTNSFLKYTSGASIVIIDNLVVNDTDKGIEYYTLTGKKIFSSIIK